MPYPLVAAVDSLQRASPPLLLVVGQERSASQMLAELSATTQTPVVNLSLLLSSTLIDLPPRDRVRRAARLFREGLRPHGGAITILDRTAILFLPDLMLNPLQLLTDASRTHGPLVAAWCGAWNGFELTYARPGHPEYQRYLHPLALVVPAA